MKNSTNIKVSDVAKKEIERPRASPVGGRRGCLCKDGKRYSRKCCDGSLQAQGIGNVN
jgi:hypothetical protein